MGVWENRIGEDRGYGKRGSGNGWKSRGGGEKECEEGQGRVRYKRH